MNQNIVTKIIEFISLFIKELIKQMAKEKQKYSLRIILHSLPNKGLSRK